MKIIPLGAGQDVGRSCIIATIEGRTIMFDCGMHMGYNDIRRFPDFSYLSRIGDFNRVLDCIIISHFHLDHSGALPYFTEVCGYNGPIYMTSPTKAVIPFLLEDFRKISAPKIKDGKFFSFSDIQSCLKKIKTINLHETFKHDEEFFITPYYAGHVIGAAMFHVQVGKKSIVYTGDYNMTPDRHLGAASIPCLRPDLLISESTYGSITRDCRKSKEREFIKAVHETVHNGGKVLIPIFALGRAQELCLLLDSYWDRLQLDEFPIYFSGGLTQKANEIYKKYIDYTNDTIKKNINERNVFDYKHILPLQKHFLDKPGPMVLFASPGMLHSGASLKVFKDWCDDEKNLVIIPGYCVKGTVGDKVLNGEKEIEILGEVKEIKIQVKNLAFSAHADAQGILNLIDMCKPKNVMLVHGEKSRISTLKKKIEERFKIKVFEPANGVIVDIPKDNTTTFQFRKKDLEKIFDETKSSSGVYAKLSIRKNKKNKIIEVFEVENLFKDDSL
ncbi:Integrator complex subunit 11 [Nosema bombycis CQ1]|uniref:Integrator complex subunit 11 n=1 Tax=Nosema bombycis (strain CQ1 / CVCC 102059) TaxID=578461 RepID=R0M5V3_NOSB1|nr:Integrator complex subunit 11 [Nosema bombycis CQ1]|eukprot:EOB13354.1 Integrator complex subunit 11 [Nosema bombycis CQ1]